MSVLMSSLNNSITLIFIVGILAVVIGFFLRRWRQPYLIGYILIGICLGEFGFDLFEDRAQVEFLGELGIILLFFFIGMEISLPSFVKQWRIAILGTMTQVLISVGIMFVIGYFFNWSLARTIVLGFVIALSSSAVVIKLLENKKMLDTKIGQNVLSILLTQDIFIAPILIITSILGGATQTNVEIIQKIIGGTLILLVFLYLYKKGEITIPFTKELEDDHELQVFLSIMMCAAGALLTGLFGLSPALGAFMGGMVVHASKNTTWIHESLHPFRIIFVALFFISIGAQINLNFLQNNINIIALALPVVFLVNHGVNAVVLRIFGCTPKDALLGGAFLAQIGEMSFLVCFSAYQAKMLNEFGYMFSICLISLTLLISPFWIAGTENLLGRRQAFE